MSDRRRHDKFTERARKVLFLAQKEAERFQQTSIGTEHLLLGLIREGEGVGVKVLASFGVDLVKVRVIAERMCDKYDDVPIREIGLTPQAKRVIELAVREALRLKHHYIGTEHLLLGLLSEEQETGAAILHLVGVDLKAARARTVQVLSQKNSTYPLNRASIPDLPLEAENIALGDPLAVQCDVCEARNHHYFHYCFNCGIKLRKGEAST